MLLREWVDTCGITHVTRAGARTELLSTGNWQQRHLYQLEMNYVLQFHPETQSWVPDFSQMTRPHSHQVLLTQELRFMLIFIYNKQFVRHIQLTAVLMCYRLKRFFWLNLSRRAVWGVGLRPLACLYCGFESRRVYGRLCLVSVVCCQEEADPSSRGILPCVCVCVCVTDCDQGETKALYTYNQ